MAKAKKKVAKKKKTTKKKASAKKKAKKKEVNEQGVPEVIRERTAKLAKKKAIADKEQKAKEKKIPEGALKRVRDDSRSRSKSTTGGERDKFTWIDILSGEIIKAYEKIRELESRLAVVEAKKS